MTYEELGQQIQQMTPEQRKCHALVCVHKTGDTALIERLVTIQDWNGEDKPYQLVMWQEQ